MKSFAIVALSVLAAVVYGIIHDQFTARICVEYFTIGHARLIDSDSPAMLGLFWGVVATWWVGLALGFELAVAARAGSRLKMEAFQLLRPLGKLVCWMSAIAFVAGLVGYLTARLGLIFLAEPLASRVPADKHVAFLTAAWAHTASYLSAVLGGAILWVFVWRSRPLVQSKGQPGIGG